MPKKSKTLLAWDGGKDSAVALFEMKSPDYKITSLVTSIEVPEMRLKNHGVKQSLIHRQAESLEMPVLFVPSQSMSDVLKPLQKKGLNGVSYSTISSDAQRSEHENFLRGLELEAYFPLWKWEKKEILRVFFSLGYKAIVTAVDLSKLPLPFVGREFDRDFIDDLPSGVDPCGENNEFQTFVYDGPFFQRPVEFSRLQVLEKHGYGIQDLE